MTERRWSEQFLALLEGLRMPDQLRAGRRYVRAGHVRELRISSSLATALVRDDDGSTVRTRVAARAFSGANWRRIESAVAQEAIHAARLLSGQVPDDLDRIVAELGLTLFPQDLDEVAMDCGCPDWRVPCRHLAATWYALAESFDNDPFTILAWRGRTRDELLGRLRTLRVAPRPSSAPPSTGGFWTAGPRVRPVADDAVARPDAVLDQLEPLDLTVGRHQVIDLLRSAYVALGRQDPRDHGATGDISA